MKSVVTKLKYIKSLIINEIRLLYIEKSVAYYTTDGNWKIIRLPTFELNRVVPEINETVEGIHLGSKRHLEIIETIYSYPGFVEVDRRDIVVDIGAYVGSFTLYASSIASKVIAVDPLASVGNSLSSNTSHLENVIVVPEAAFSEKMNIDINISNRPSKTSLLSPKMGNQKSNVQVQANTVSTIVAKCGYTSVDFLKVEAEGVEPEILRKVLDDEIEVEKVAVDAGPERNGEDIIDEIRVMLETAGYRCKMKDGSIMWGDNIVFARKI
jgi:FkbM family methyltransferase